MTMYAGDEFYDDGVTSGPLPGDYPVEGAVPTGVQNAWNEQTEQHHWGAPRRIQRKRTKGWRMPEGAVYVGRPTKWGNPYRPDEVATATDVVNVYRHVLLGEYDWPELTVTVEDARRELRGRDLVCWCPLDQPCHADVLLELANA